MMQGACVYITTASFVRLKEVFVITAADAGQTGRVHWKTNNTCSMIIMPTSTLLTPHFHEHF